MQINRKNERGSVMVEAIAVVALLGLMGSLLYRQVRSRNDELDNINMASETRMVKDATTAFLQADQASLVAECSSGRILTSDEMADVESFMPYNWQSDDGAEDGIIYSYNIYLTCSELDPELAPGRKALYATIIPQEKTLPPNFNLKRAARVANLIGSDGGVHTQSEAGGKLAGTMGAWEIECSEDWCHEGYYFVATTGTDIYIPEADTPDNTVLVPKQMAFKELHSANYFSVGEGNYNCVTNMEEGKFAHEVATDAGDYAKDDAIARVGDGSSVSPCSPLFWVGTVGSSADNSKAGHVYVKKNLYIGRDNGNNTQVVAIERDDDTNANRQIVVYDTEGKSRLILNAKGQIVGRKSGTSGLSSGYRLDSETGDIVLFKEYEVAGHVIQIPTLRLNGSKMESSVRAKYYNGDEGKEKEENYFVDPSDTSLMNDIRLTSRGGAKLSEILPDYIAKKITSITQDGTTGHTSDTVDKPECPKGYVRAITVTPIQSHQDIIGVNLASQTLDVNTTDNNVTIPEVNATTKTPATGTLHQTLKDADAKITVTQHDPVSITIENATDKWDVTLKYGNMAPNDTDPITALVHTYCVYDNVNFDGETGVSSEISVAKGLRQEAGEETTSETRTCTKDEDCDSAAEYCIDSLCVSRPTCSDPDNTKIGPDLYCIDGIQVYVKCFADSDCKDTETCNTNSYQCVEKGV